MIAEEDVQELLDGIKKALEELSPGPRHFRTVYEAQIYVLKKVLAK